MKKTIVEKHFDGVAKTYDLGKSKYSLYYSTLKELLKSLIPTESSVFEFGCGTGELLASTNPKKGYGMDISSVMIKIAKLKYKDNSNLDFSTEWPDGKYEYIFMTDVIEHLEKPTKEFKQIVKLMAKETVFINTMANPIWEPLLLLWEKMGLKMQEGPHKRISYEEIEMLCEKVGMKIIKHDYKLLIPVSIPILTNLINKHLERPFKKLAFIEYLVAVRS